MNPWPFVITAYALVIGGMAVLVAVSYRQMRRAERQADELRRER